MQIVFDCFLTNYMKRTKTFQIEFYYKKKNNKKLIEEVILKIVTTLWI